MAANQAAAQLQGWQIEENQADYFLARDEKSLWSGEVSIMAIYQGGKVYVNSGDWRNPINLGRFQSNERALLQQYRIAAAGKDMEKEVAQALKAKEEAFWAESEWSVKNILKRFVGYGLCALFLLLAYVGVKEQSWESVLVAIVLLGFCGNYIFHNIKVLREKRKRRQEHW